MGNFFQARALGKLLVDEGVLPKNCRNAEILIPQDGALMIRYEVFVEQDDIPKVLRALSKLVPPPKDEAP